MDLSSTIKSLGTLNLYDSNMTEYFKVENGINIMILPREYKEVHINCILPPRIDAIIPLKGENGMELHAYGKFYLYGQLVTEAHLMLWNKKWWDRTTR